MSTMTGEVTAHQADKNAPNITQQMTNAQYSSQKGIARGAIPPRPRAMNVTTRAFTPGRSVRIPDNILQSVLQIPTIEIRKEAFTADIPFDWAKSGRKT